MRGYNISIEHAQELARAIAQLESEPDRPGTKVDCMHELARRLDWPWATVKGRMQALRFAVKPAPDKKPPKDWKIRL